MALQREMLQLQARPSSAPQLIAHWPKFLHSNEHNQCEVRHFNKLKWAGL